MSKTQIPAELPLGINYSHPLAANIVFFAVPHGEGFIDLVSKTLSSKSGSTDPSPVITDLGRAVNFSGGRDQFDDIAHGITNGDLTIWCRHRWDGSGGNYQTCMSIDNDLSLYTPSASSSEIMAIDTTSDSTTNFSAINEVISGEWKDYSVSLPGSGNTGTGYIDGITKSSDSLSYSLAATSIVEMGSGQGNEYANGDTQIGIIFNKALSKEEQQLLTQDPWALVRRPKPSWFYKALSAGGLSITPSGLSSEEAFGSASLTTGAVDISPTGLSSEEAVGSHSVSAGGINLLPSGVSSAEVIGTHVVDTGGVSVVPSGISSLEVFGAANLDSTLYITDTGNIVSEEVFGDHTVVFDQSIVISSIASAEAFGATKVLFLVDDGSKVFMYDIMTDILEDVTDKIAH